jgi:hypothetical protein
LPTEEELDALGFSVIIREKAGVNITLPLKIGCIAGQTIFNDIKTGKCFACHFNARANANLLCLDGVQ